MRVLVTPDVSQNKEQIRLTLIHDLRTREPLLSFGSLMDPTDMNGK